MFLPIANFSFAIMSARRPLWRWRVQRQLIVALEFGYDEKIVKRVMKKHEFDSSGDLIDYLYTHMEELEAEEEVDEEVKPEVDEEPSPEEVPQATKHPEEQPSASLPPEEQKEVPQAPSAPPPPIERSLREETEDLYRRSVCLNCFERRRCFVVLPCSHFTICDKCEKHLKKCPARDCGEVIERTVKTFM